MPGVLYLSDQLQAFGEEFNELVLRDPDSDLKNSLDSIILPQFILFSLLASQQRKENRIFSFHVILT